MDELIERGSNVIMNTYSRFPIALDHGEGMYAVSYTHLDVYKRQLYFR